MSIVRTSKEAVLAEITRIASFLGKAPGVERFTRDTGIPKHHWLGVYWSKWSDAINEAGLSTNQLNGRLDSSRIIRQLAEVCLKIGRVPAKAEMQMIRRSDPSFPYYDVFNSHFGDRAGSVAALRELARSDAAFASLAALLPASGSLTQKRRVSSSGWVYLLKSGAHYKVGRSETIERRIKEVSVALPEQVLLVHAIETDDPAGIEGYWHRRFADQRMNGEWFKLSTDDVAAFRRRKFQ